MFVRIENWLLPREPDENLKGLKRFCVEFLFFGLKMGRACLFAFLIFGAMFIVPKAGIGGVPRFDVLLFFSLLIQIGMVALKLETWDEVKVVALFYILGFLLETFKTSPEIQAFLLPEGAPHIRASWVYTDFAYTKIGNVPLFAGFMYSAVASFIVQVWQLLDFKVHNMPPYWLADTSSILIYLHFFTRHAFKDLRWWLVAFVLCLYARSYVVFKPYDRARRIPLIMAFVIMGLFIWLAENIATFAGIWQYPYQLNGWTMVSLTKISSWSLLLIIAVTIVTHLKSIKTSVFVSKE